MPPSAYRALKKKKDFEILLINFETEFIFVNLCLMHQEQRHLQYQIYNYVPAEAESTQNNTKLKSGFKRTINWNKYRSKVLLRSPNQYLDYFINPTFKELENFLLF